MSVKRNKKITRFMLLLLALMVSLSACSENQVYETDDLSCYGQFPDDKNAETAQEKFDLWFPAEIDPSWENVFYHYKSIDSLGDACSYEAELGFQISDFDTFLAFKMKLVDQGTSCVFPFLEGTTICFFETPFYQLIENPYSESNDLSHYHIEAANIQAVLLNEKEQSVYFLSHIILDGGGASIDDFRLFFDLFSIDPVEFSSFIENYRIEKYGNLVISSSFFRC